MDTTLLVLAIATIAIVLIFEYTNGFHDAANIIATVIASRAMTPAQAVLLVAFFEFLGPLLVGTAVANTIGTFITLDDLDRVLALVIVLCGLVGAIAWNLLTWWFGIPSSSSHALVGGLAGVVMVAAGAGHVVWGFGDLLHGHLNGVAKVIVALILSPLIGFWVGFALHKTMLALLRGAHPSINRDLRHLQFVTSAGLAFAHGANDAQKSMGILTLVLLLAGFIPTFEVPFWVMLACSLRHHAGHPFRRLADRAHAGLLHLQDSPLARARFADDRRRRDPGLVAVRRPGLHHARGRLLDHGHRRFGAPQGCALGQGARDRHHLADHHPRCGIDGD